MHFLWGCDIGQTSVGKDIVNTAGGILNGISFGLSNGWSASNGVDTCSTGFSIGFAGSMLIPGAGEEQVAKDTLVIGSTAILRNLALGDNKFTLLDKFADDWEVPERTRLGTTVSCGEHYMG